MPARRPHSHEFGRRIRLAVFSSLLIAVLVVNPVFAASAPLESEVKAAFLLNFTKFIEWPAGDAEPGDPFAICIWGDNPFGSVLDKTFRGESVNGQPLVVQRIGRNPAKSCRVLYIDHSEKGVKDIVKTLGPGVLTVGEGEGFIQDGGMIAFVLENRRVRFSINLAAARAASLTLSSRLLAIARSVEK